MKKLLLAVAIGLVLEVVSVLGAIAIAHIVGSFSASLFAQVAAAFPQ